MVPTTTLNSGNPHRHYQLVWSLPLPTKTLYLDNSLMPPRIVVKAELGGLESALRISRTMASAGVREARRRTYYTGPAETRRLKSRRARMRLRRRRG